MGNRIGSSVVGAVVLAVVALAVPRHGSACGNEVALKLSPAKLVAEGEHLVNAGQLAGGRDHVRMVLVPGFGATPGLRDAALAVAARAVVRSDGDLPMLSSEPLEPKREGAGTPRMENLRDAVGVLRKMADKKPGDPGAQTDLGEGLSRLPEESARAQQLLVGLEDKGVMTSAWGYAALTRLRDRAGADEQGWLGGPLAALAHAPRAISFARCSKMAVRKEICTGEKVDTAPPHPGPVRAKRRAHHPRPVTLGGGVPQLD